MRLLVALTVGGSGLYAAAPVGRVTGVNWALYLLVVLLAAGVTPLLVPSWERRHPDRCAYCHGHGAHTFISEKRLRTRCCFVCDGTGRRPSSS